MTPPCPCSSSKTYQECCKRLHKEEPAKNALELMQARYAAYVLNIPEYIIATTHPASPLYMENKHIWKQQITEFSKSTTFQKLEILDFKEQGNLATVVFTVHAMYKTENSTFTEKSHFEKLKNQWLYRGGQIVEGHAPNLVTTGSLKLLPLAYYGDPILRRKADSIQEITDDIKKLVEEMIETMEVCDGCGLAAPQIHHSIRLFIAKTPIGNSRELWEEGVKVFINPKLSSPSTAIWKASEGCLSIPSIHANVARPKEITVEYTTLDGKVVTERLSGWAAKVVMHENDHINGVLFIDRIDKKERDKLEPLLQNLKNRIHDGKEL